ncbi:hypothetical protein B0H14DRAFT_3470987 [Mycena olivaceomarginata]|nr:hypothetical protein B0H14DRAFT_3470987 [Mycena olivaceomarginata]
MPRALVTAFQQDKRKKPKKIKHTLVISQAHSSRLALVTEGEQVIVDEENSFVDDLDSPIPTPCPSISHSRASSPFDNMDDSDEEPPHPLASVAATC